MPATIEITIRNGKISLNVEGVEDASCADITRALESALGEVEDVQHKPQYYNLLDPIEQFAYEDEE